MQTVAFLVFLGVLVHEVIPSRAAEACPYTIEKVGCFWDKRGEEGPTMKLSLRKKIPWESPEHYQELLQSFACNCSEVAAEMKYNFFGLQYWGECWIGEAKHFIRPNKVPHRCFMPNGQDINVTCDDSSTDICVGNHWTNYVYKFVQKAPAPVCKDKHPQCPNFKSLCDNDQYGVKPMCPFTCNACPTA